MSVVIVACFFFFSSRRRHTRCLSDWSSDVCSSDLGLVGAGPLAVEHVAALRTVRELDRVVVWSRTEERIAEFCKALELRAELDDERSEERRVGKECRARGWPYD